MSNLKLFLCHTVICSAVNAAHVFVLLFLQLMQTSTGIIVLNLCLEFRLL